MSKPLIDKHGEVRELTVDDFKNARPARDVVPDVVAAAKRGPGRPKQDVTKVQVTMRLSPSVVEHFRSTGKGWQTRIDEVLMRHVKKNP